MNEATKPLTFVSPIHKAGRQISLYLSQQTAALAIPPSEAHLLSYLQLYGPCRVGELIRVFGYKNTTMTGILDRLEQQGYIKRELDPGDRRSFLVKITNRGGRLGARGRQIVEVFDRSVSRRVTRADLRGFQNVMAAIAEVTGVDVRQGARKRINKKR